MYDEVSRSQAAENTSQRCQAVSRKQHDCCWPKGIAMHKTLVCAGWCRQTCIHTVVSLAAVQHTRDGVFGCSSHSGTETGEDPCPS